MANINEAAIARFARKAQGLLKRRGGKLRFIGGTALDPTTTVGMKDLLRQVTKLKDREYLAEAISQCLRHAQHDWTIIYGFIFEEGMEDGLPKFGVDVDSRHIRGATSEEMAMAANYIMAREFRDAPEAERLGQVWMAIPTILPESVCDQTYIKGILDWMNECGFFDAEHMRQRLAQIAAVDIVEQVEALEELEAETA